MQAKGMSEISCQLLAISSQLVTLMAHDSIHPTRTLVVNAAVTDRDGLRSNRDRKISPCT